MESVLQVNKNNNLKLKVKKIAFLSVKWFFLLLLSVFFLFPIYALVINSFIPPEQTIDKLWPNRLTFQAYTDMFTLEYLGYLKNTIFVCVMNILGTCIGASLCAYGLAKVRFKGSKVVFMIIMATVLLPGTVTSIPLYIIYNDLNWTGTLYPLWIPIWLGGGAMNIFLVRQFMKGIPNSYSEAAILDGASSFHIYYAIILPLIRPILVYLAVTTFFGCWNDYTGPLMYVLDKKESWTLSLALYKDFVVPESTKVKYVSSQMAVGVMMMIPCVILFAFFQKELMEGISAIGIKG